MMTQYHVLNSWSHRLLIILFVLSSDSSQVDQTTVQNKIVVMSLFSQRFFSDSLIVWLCDKLLKSCNQIYSIFLILLQCLLFSIRNDDLDKWALNKASRRCLKLNCMLFEWLKRLIDLILMLCSMQMWISLFEALIRSILITQMSLNLILIEFRFHRSNFRCLIIRNT
jgi:hypothetical protein